MCMNIFLNDTVINYFTLLKKEIITPTHHHIFSLVQSHHMTFRFVFCNFFMIDLSDHLHAVYESASMARNLDFPLSLLINGNNLNALFLNSILRLVIMNEFLLWN